MKYRIIVYEWNPNGTNDIEIEGSYSDDDPWSHDSLPEALFGLDVTKFKPRYSDPLWQAEFGGYYVPLKECLKRIAVSPVSNGLETIKFLSKYFKSVKVG